MIKNPARRQERAAQFTAEERASRRADAHKLRAQVHQWVPYVSALPVATIMEALEEALRHMKRPLHPVHERLFKQMRLTLAKRRFQLLFHIMPPPPPEEPQYVRPWVSLKTLYPTPAPGLEGVSEVRLRQVARDILLMMQGWGRVLPQGHLKQATALYTTLVGELVRRLGPQEAVAYLKLGSLEQSHTLLRSR